MGGGGGILRRQNLDLIKLLTRCTAVILAGENEESALVVLVSFSLGAEELEGFLAT